MTLPVLRSTAQRNILMAMCSGLKPPNEDDKPESEAMRVPMSVSTCSGWVARLELASAHCI